jgi:hypothetical protein
MASGPERDPERDLDDVERDLEQDSKGVERDLQWDPERDLPPADQPLLDAISCVARVSRAKSL